MKCQNSKSLKFKATQLQLKKTIFNWIPFLCSDVRFISLLWCTLHPIWKSMGFSSINLQSQYSNGFYQLESNWYLHQFKPLRQIGPQVYLSPIKIMIWEDHHCVAILCVDKIYVLSQCGVRLVTAMLHNRWYVRPAGSILINNQTSSNIFKASLNIFKHLQTFL